MENEVEDEVAVVYVRISDTVLDEPDWPVRKLTVTTGGGVVAHEDLLPEGVYSVSGMPVTGWTLEKLLKWTAVDNTGHHPEVCHDIRPHGSPKWEYISQMEDLRALIHRAQVAR